MHQIYRIGLLYLISSTPLYAAPNSVELAVWVNEAITATYTYDAAHYLEQQRSIAKYFTSPGWVKYSTALNASGLPETVQKNKYFVNSVATWPPTVQALGANRWKAVMPLLVTYKNPQYQQKQNLEVTVFFSVAPQGGIRGLAIDALQTKKSTDPCPCTPAEAAQAPS